MLLLGRPRLSTELALCFLAMVITVGNAWFSLRLWQPSKVSQRSYSYLGDDFPEFYIPELGDMSPVAMTMEESRHYPIFGPNGLDEWATGSPVGQSFVRLGPEYRGFAVAMFHELHCLHVIRFVLAADTPSNNAIHHLQHCLNYLRQFILCDPNLTLEPVDVLTRDFEMQREGATHVCTDWSQIYEEMAENWSRWEPIRNLYKSNGTQPAVRPT